MSNSEVLSIAGTERKLIQAVRRRQLQFLGHVLRKQELEEVALTGKIEGKEREESKGSPIPQTLASGWKRVRWTFYELLKTANYGSPWPPTF